MDGDSGARRAVGKAGVFRLKVAGDWEICRLEVGGWFGNRRYGWFRGHGVFTDFLWQGGGGCARVAAMTTKVSGMGYGNLKGQISYFKRKGLMGGWGVSVIDIGVEKVFLQTVAVECVLGSVKAGQGVQKLQRPTSKLQRSLNERGEIPKYKFQAPKKCQVPNREFLGLDGGRQYAQGADFQWSLLPVKASQGLDCALREEGTRCERGAEARAGQTLREVGGGTRLFELEISSVPPGRIVRGLVF